MNRKVLIIEKCCDCPYLHGGAVKYEGKLQWHCSYNQTELPLKASRDVFEIVNDAIPEWCELPDLPEKLDADEGVYSDPLERVAYGMKLGWNSCIDAVEGQTAMEDEYERL